LAPLDVCIGGQEIVLAVLLHALIRTRMIFDYRTIMHRPQQGVLKAALIPAAILPIL